MEARRDSSVMLDLLRRSLEKVERKDEIVSLFEQVLGERDELAKRQEHIRSLERLVEMTVAAADDLSAQIRKEAENNAQSQGEGILSEARATAQQIIEDARATAAAETKKALDDMQKATQLELQSMVGQQAAHLREQLAEISGRLYEEMVAQADETKRRIDSLQVGVEKRLSSPSTSPPPAGEAAAPKGNEAVEGWERPDASFVTLAADLSSTPESVVGPEKGKRRTGAPGVVELEVQLPRDKAAIKSIKDYLERLDEVEAAEVTHLTDKTLIHLLLREPIDVAERLVGLPEVDRVVSQNNGNKIQIVLAVVGEMKRERDALSLKANRIASRIPGAAG